MSIGDDSRNPLLLPDVVDRRPACSKCGHWGFSARNVQGVIYRRCAECGTVEMGGLPQVPVDPRIPAPPQNPRDKPTVEFVRNARGELEEKLNRPDLRTDFRKGAPIPGPGEE